MPISHFNHGAILQQINLKECLKPEFRRVPEIAVNPVIE